ncbi:hypothetical protein K5549_006251 [Capra hircus]|uniref:Uncharacterized protein n=1 Tax=Capra hircus TaxID=9925 RepID=A0A452F9Q5_CAPHI|nr:hypothetical protein K5549_006251 [Capra hircus]
MCLYGTLLSWFSSPSHWIMHALVFLIILTVLLIVCNGGVTSRLHKYYCEMRSGRCALIGCLQKEEQIGRYSLSG